MRHIVMYSGGIASWATAHRVISRGHSPTLLFADTNLEDGDLHRFLEEGSRALTPDPDLVRIEDGREPWDVFKKERMMGNTRNDPCSKILKRKLIRKWMNAHCDPGDTTIYLGFTWDESHRFDPPPGSPKRGAKDYWKPWIAEAPLLDPPYVARHNILESLRSHGVDPPRLTKQGFPHNNCGGFCVKAGQAQFAKLLGTYPERYAYHEFKELQFREFIGKDVSILRDRRGSDTKTMTLRDFRLRVERGQSHDLFDWGGCACMEPGEDSDE